MSTFVTPFVSAREIQDAVFHGKGYTVLASQWDTTPNGGYVSFASEHLPTAQFCDPAQDLAGLPDPSTGRNPLPDPDLLQPSLRRWGVRAGCPVIVYDRGHGVYAGRAWWILRWAGVTDVHILAGGLKEWERTGGAIIGGPGNIAYAADPSTAPGSMPTATIDDVRAHNGLLIDVRQPNRYGGRRELLDLKAGHIPGAVNVPLDELLDDYRRPLDTDAIRERFAAEGITDTTDAIIYSGSGMHSSLAIALMETAGLATPRHYVGGWSQWSADPANPVELAP